MNKNNNDRDVEYVDAEYVDAQPIEGSGAPAPREPHAQPQVYTYYHRSESCTPCCGPIGCSFLIIILIMLLGSPELLEGALYAIAIMVVVSVLAKLFVRRG